MAAVSEQAIQRRRVQDRRRNATRYAAARVAVFGHYGIACACCGVAEELTIDHVDGGGAEHRHRLRTHAGVRFYAWLIRQGFPEGYQVLCAPCNVSKGGGQACRLWHGDPRYRRCTGPCGRVLLLGLFNLDGRTRTGHQSRCRKCQAAT